MHHSGLQTRAWLGRGDSTSLPVVRCRRFFAGAILVALLLAATSLLSPGIAGAQSSGYVDTDVLNLRSGPGLWADVVTTMWQGDAVSVLDGPTSDGWYEVDYAGLEGWAYGGFLAIDGSSGWSDGTDAPAVGGWAADAWVDTDRVNVRSAASTDAWALGYASSGDELTVVGNPVGGFYPVSGWGQTGWVWADYLSFDGPPAPVAERWIDVSRTSGAVTLFEGDTAIATYWGSMGFDTSADGFYSTAIGTYYVYVKYEPLNWTPWGQVYITDWVGFDPERQNGFHSYSRDASGSLLANGGGLTGGCIALPPGDAEALYNFASYGMRVEIHF